MADTPSSPAAPSTSTAPTGAAPAASAPPTDGGGGASPPVAPPAAPRTWALKFGDRTEELTEEQLVHRAQKGYGAEQAFREAAEIRKQQAEFKAALADPMKAREYIRKNGGDPDILMQKWALDWHQQREMTPEQKKIAEAETRAREAESKLQTHEQQVAAQRFQAETEKAHGTLVETFSAAVAKVAGANVDPATVSPRLLQAMANWQQANLATGTGAPPELVAQAAVETALADGVAALHLYKGQPAALVKHLGPELVAAVINEVVRVEDERAGLAPRQPSRPQVVNGNGTPNPNRNPDGTFKPSGRESREKSSFDRFINGGGG